MSEIKSCLYRGMVTHQRLIPLKHRLAYRVFMLFIDLSELAVLDRREKWFGYNRFAFFSFHDADHGARDKSITLRDWTMQKLQEAKIDCRDGTIKILCFPRVLGYVFNPLSIMFCYDRDNRLRAVLYEVKNTFGEQHGYLFPVDDASAPVIEQTCKKSFYVSPFIGMQAQYRFTLSPPDDKFGLIIRQSVEAGEMLVANWTGRREAWSNKALRSCFWRYPLLTLKIIVSIHWHGLQLFLKGARFHRRPPLPQDRVSIHISHD